jgi:hypothetical protein
LTGGVSAAAAAASAKVNKQKRSPAKDGAEGSNKGPGPGASALSISVAATGKKKAGSKSKVSPVEGAPSAAAGTGAAGAVVGKAKKSPSAGKRVKNTAMSGDSDSLFAAVPLHRVDSRAANLELDGALFMEDDGDWRKVMDSFSDNPPLSRNISDVELNKVHSFSVPLLVLSSDSAEQEVAQQLL